MNTNTAQLKAFLHKLIVETEDEQILSKVEAFFTTPIPHNYSRVLVISISHMRERNLQDCGALHLMVQLSLMVTKIAGALHLL